MRKMKSSLFLLFLILAFSACQNNDEIVSPETNSVQNQTLEKITMTEINLNNPGANTCIELVAGRNIVVGEVCVDYIESTHKLKVTYTMTEPDWTITKTHVAAVIHPLFFPRTWTLQPRLSHFPYKGTHENVTSVEYMINIPYYYDNVYLAIHAKVEGNMPSGDPVLEPSLPVTDVMIPAWKPSGTEYMVKSDFNNLGTYFGWSIDNERYLSSGVSREIRFISTYSEELPGCTAFVENISNLPLVNWIINHREASWDRNTVQAAIWNLLQPVGGISNWQDPNASNYFEHNAQLREQIVAAAYANGVDYEPACGDKVLILAYGPEADPCNLSRNVIGFEYLVDCQTQNVVKNAWAFPYENGQPVLDLSKRFSWIGWARYVKYSLD
jgi:hypothetical protein